MGLFDAPDNRSFVSIVQLEASTFSSKSRQKTLPGLFPIHSRSENIQLTHCCLYIMPLSLPKLVLKCAKQLGVPFKALSDEEKAKKAAEAERKKKGESDTSSTK